MTTLQSIKNHARHNAELIERGNRILTWNDAQKAAGGKGTGYARAYWQQAKAGRKLMAIFGVDALKGYRKGKDGVEIIVWNTVKIYTENAKTGRQIFFA